MSATPLRWADQGGRFPSPSRRFRDGPRDLRERLNMRRILGAGVHAIVQVEPALRHVQEWTTPAGLYNFCPMVRRIIALLAALYLAIVATAATAHAARATLEDAVVSAHAGHAAMADSTHAACGEKSGCSAGDADSCAAACAALICFIVPVQGDVFVDHFTITHVRPVDSMGLGHNPGLNERPPQTRLL